MLKLLPRSWKTEDEMGTEEQFEAQYPQVAVDGSGNAVAVWHQDNGTRDTVFSNEYTRY